MTVADIGEQDMQSFRASEDDLTKRVADTLRIIAEALQKRDRHDARELKRDLRPLEMFVTHKKLTRFRLLRNSLVISL